MGSDTVWGMPDHTRLAVIGDIHAHLLHLRRVVSHLTREPIAGVLLVGDLGSSDLERTPQPSAAQRAAYLASVEQVLAVVRTLPVPVLWVPGNHDLPTLQGEGCVDRGAVAAVGGLRVTGIGGAGPEHFGFPYEWTEDDIRARTLPPCDVLLCHAPPARTPLDRLRSGTHVGSEAIRERAEALRGILVCGHIHESPGVTRLGDCLCMNVGGLGRPYGRPQVGFIEGTHSVSHLDLDSGKWLHLIR